MSRSVKIKSSNWSKRGKWAASFFLIAALMMCVPATHAKDATLEFKVVPPDCQVTQVTENGETKDVFTPAGCDAPVQPVTPETPVDNATPTPPQNAPSYEGFDKILSPVNGGKSPNSELHVTTKPADTYSYAPLNIVIALSLFFGTMLLTVVGWLYFGRHQQKDIKQSSRSKKD